MHLTPTRLADQKNERPWAQIRIEHGIAWATLAMAKVELDEVDPNASIFFDEAEEVRLDRFALTVEDRSWSEIRDLVNMTLKTKGKIPMVELPASHQDRVFEDTRAETRQSYISGTASMVVKAVVMMNRMIAYGGSPLFAAGSPALTAASKLARAAVENSLSTGVPCREGTFEGIGIQVRRDFYLANPHLTYAARTQAKAAALTKVSPMRLDAPTTPGPAAAAPAGNWIIWTGPRSNHHLTYAELLVKINAMPQSERVKRHNLFLAVLEYPDERVRWLDLRKDMPSANDIDAANLEVQRACVRQYIAAENESLADADPADRVNRLEKVIKNYRTAAKHLDALADRAVAVASIRHLRQVGNATQDGLEFLDAAAVAMQARLPDGTFIVNDDEVRQMVEDASNLDSTGRGLLLFRSLVEPYLPEGHRLERKRGASAFAQSVLPTGHGTQQAPVYRVGPEN